MQRASVPVLTFFALLVGAAVSAQTVPVPVVVPVTSTEAVPQEPTPGPLVAEAIKLATTDARREAAPGLSPLSSTMSSWAQDGRACEGCPRRRVGWAFIDATVINGFYEIANLARGQATAKITMKSWWDNMKQGWVWDLDDFTVNQIGHPYQGNNYFNAGRANGLSFWESAGVTAFGSATWEYFGETNHASVNDLINTTLGGIALGEMFHRTAWLLRNTEATGKKRLMGEIGAMAIDPITGASRFISDDSSKVSEKPPDMVPTSLRGRAMAGVLWRGSNTSVADAAGDPFLEMDVVYGTPGTGRSRTPYDAFAVLFRLGGGGAISEVKVRGRLMGQPMAHEGLQFNVSQAYDYNKNNAYQFGAQSFNVSASHLGKISPRLSYWLSGFAGLTALGAVDSIPLTGKVETPVSDDPAKQGVSEGPRYYDYGPGSNVGGTVFLARDGRVLSSFTYEGHQLYSLDGVRANHFLQQLRLDVLAPIHGPVGLGVSTEYFDRRTYYQDAANTTKKFHYPQARVYLTWRL